LSEVAAQLTTPVEHLPGITPRQADSLRTLGLTNLGRLIAHLPMRHEKIEAESPIGELTPDQVVSARGDVTATRLVRAGRPRFEAVLHDGTDGGRLDLVWFNQSFMKSVVVPGVRLRVQGKVKKRGPGLQMANPKWEVIKPGEEEPPVREERMRPIYPANENIKSAAIERLIERALPVGLPLIEDHLTAEYRAERALPELREAYQMQHTPASEEDVPRSRRRLAYDELLLLQLGVQMKRAHLRTSLRAPALKWNKGIDKHLRERFPFTLTPSQDEVISDIARDLSRTIPTNRLVQGDVGSGKTIVALYAMLMAVSSGAQASLMAPTELLAEQHYLSITRILEGSRVRVELLTGSVAPAAREPMLARLAEGAIDILIGTHALLTSTVRFKSLAVAIIDEQHRFGVVQRAALREQASDVSSTPHVLVMTATPIPRTLAITLLGDLDVSSIQGLPPGRKPITTKVASFADRTAIYAHIRARLNAGEQAYVVAPAIYPPGGAQSSDGELGFLPAIEPLPAQEGIGGMAPASAAPPLSAGPPLRDITTLATDLEQTYLPGKRIAMMHGQLSRQLREAIMERFRAGLIDCLVATTIIEVGVDVPNAAVMVIEQADRFGLAQLHQLRGRVGRGGAQSECFLIADPTTPEALERLTTIERSTDGFHLAEKDLELRGPGQIFGSRQSGLPPFKVADLTRDRQLLTMARKDAAAWIKESPRLSRPEEHLVLRRMLKAYGRHLGLGDTG